MRELGAKVLAIKYAHQRLAHYANYASVLTYPTVQIAFSRCALRASAMGFKLTRLSGFALLKTLTH
jgi:hypothetical protein